MESMKMAGELMIPLEEYPHVPYWFTLRQVTAVMEKMKSPRAQEGGALARFALIFDEGYKLLGITRRRDILRGLELDDWAAAAPRDRQREPGDPGVPRDLGINQMRAKAERPVSEVMLPIRSTVDYEDHLMKVIHEMVRNNLSMLPVLRENRVVGVIRSVEVFQEIAQFIL